MRTLVLETGYLPKKHRRILLNLFDLQEITVDDVMVPRNQIETVDLDAPLEQLARQAATAYHRRLLAYSGEPDEIAGTLRARHVLNLVQQGGLTREQLMKLVRDPYFLPSGTPLFSQLQSFQEHQDRIALIVDEYGELKGLVTLEDILEEVIGEFTTPSPLHSGGYYPQFDGSFLVDGSTPLRQLNRKLGFRFSAGWAKNRKRPCPWAPSGNPAGRHPHENRRPPHRNHPDAGSHGQSSAYFSRTRATKHRPVAISQD